MSWLSSFINTSHTQLSSTMNENSNNSNNNNAVHCCFDESCDENDCAGIRLICSWCQKPTFLSCLIDQVDIKCLVNAVMKKSLDSIVSLPLSSTYGTRISDAFQTIFQQQTNIDFVCSQCKSIGTFGEIVASNEKNLSEAKKKADAARNTIVTLKQEHAAAIDILTQQLAFANAKISELNNSAIVSKHYVCEDFIEKKASVDSLLNEMISASENQTTHLQQLSSALRDIMATSHDQSKSNDDVTHSDTLRDSNELHIESLQANGASNLSQKLGDKIPHTTSNLLPPIRESNDDNTSSNSDDAFAIYVSKFHPNTSCEDITSHIIGKTKLKSSDFGVKLMAGKRILNSKRLTFVSFKISASTNVVQLELLNENLWAPNFKAEPFNQKSSSVSNKNDSVPQKQKQQQQQKLQPPSNASAKSEPNQRNIDGSSSVNERKSAIENVPTSENQKNNNKNV